MDITFGTGSGRTFAQAVALVTQANTRLVQVGPSTDTLAASALVSAKPGLFIQGNGDPVVLLNASAGVTLYIVACGQGNRIENLNLFGAMRVSQSSVLVRGCTFTRITGVTEPSAGYLIVHTGADTNGEFVVEYHDTHIIGSGIYLNQAGVRVATLLRFANVEVKEGKVSFNHVDRLDVAGLKISDWSTVASTALFGNPRAWMIRDLEITHSAIPVGVTTYGLRLEGATTHVADHVAGPVLERMVVRDIQGGMLTIAVQIQAVWDSGLIKDCEIRTGSIKFRAVSTTENAASGWEVVGNRILHNPAAKELHGLHVALRQSRIHHNEIRTMGPHLLFVGDDNYTTYYPADEEFFGFANEFDHNVLESYRNTNTVADREAYAFPDKGRATHFHDNLVIQHGSETSASRCYSATGKNALVHNNTFISERPTYGSPGLHAWINDLAWAGVQAAGNRYYNNCFLGMVDHFATSSSGNGTGWSEDHNHIEVENILVSFDQDNRLALHATSFGIAAAAAEPWRLDWGGDPAGTGVTPISGYANIGPFDPELAGACCGSACRILTPTALLAAVDAGKLPEGGTAAINISSEDDRALFDTWNLDAIETPANLTKVNLIAIS